MKNRLIPVVSMMLGLFAASTASAQRLGPILDPVIDDEHTGTWQIKASNVVSPANPSTTIEVWASYTYPRSRYCFLWGDFDLQADEGVFSAPKTFLVPSAGLGSSGAIGAGGNSVTGVQVGQFGVLSSHANWDNPVLVWSATWTATDFTPRTIDLRTQNTTTFILGEQDIFIPIPYEIYPTGFTPGIGAVSVVPSPMSAVPILLLGMGAFRPRRRVLAAGS